MRHIITGKERGHRPPLSKDEPTAPYSIKLLLSLAQFLREIGTDEVRKVLSRYMKRVLKKRKQQKDGE